MEEKIDLEERAKIILDVEENLKSLVDQLKNFKDVSTQLNESKDNLSKTNMALLGLIESTKEIMNKASETIQQLKKIDLEAILNSISSVERREKKLFITVIILLMLNIAGVVSILKILIR